MASAGSPRAPRSPEQRAARAGLLRARRRRALGVLAIAVTGGVAFVIVHQSGARPASAAPRRHLAPLTVGEASCTFVDATRSTPTFSATAATGTTPGRRLVTEIRYPTVSGHKGAQVSIGVAPARRRGPFPLIVFAHGYNLTPDTYAALLDSWVRAGFVVAAPLFPDTNASYVAARGDSGLPEDDLVNQPGDVAFVAHAVLGASAQAVAGCSVVRHLIDAGDGVALAGQSDGATTVAMAAFDTTPGHGANLAGLKVRAVAILSGAPYGKDRYVVAPGAPRVLVVQSATDNCNTPIESTTLYDDLAGAPRGFLKIDSATHLGPYDGSASSALSLVAAVTTRLFEFSLLHRGSGAAIAAAGDASPAVGAYSDAATAPVMPSVAENIADCFAR